MKAAAFGYLQPASVDAALHASTEDARFMAGSQSLGPMLNLRLAEPGTVVDVRRLPTLRTCSTDHGTCEAGR